MLILLATLLFVAVPSTVLATEIPGIFEDPSGFASGILDALGSGDHRLVAAFAILGAVALARRYASRLWSALESGKAAAIMSVVLGALLALGSALAGDIDLGGAYGILKILVNGAISGFIASGIYSGAKKLSEKKPVE